jgi:hypothetical protein
MSFEEKIVEWVSTDNKIKKYNEVVKAERLKRTQLGEEILSIAETNNLQNSVIEITDGKLKFQNTRIAAPLTYKFIGECLTECLNKESSDKIIKFMKQKREIKYSQEVKRYYN